MSRDMRNDAAEEALIGSLLMAPQRMSEVARVVRPEHFFDGLLRAMFGAFLTIQKAGKLIEPLIVLEHVRGSKIVLSEKAAERIADAAYFISQITQPTSAHAVHYAGLVAAAGIRRELAALGSRLHTIDEDDKREETVQQMVKLTAELSQVENATKPFTTLGDECLRYLGRMRDGEKQLVDLGLAELDYAIGGGVAFGEMVVLAARPSNGKTLAAMQFVEHLANQGYPGLILSEEMAASLLAERSLGHVTTIHREHWFHHVNEIEEQTCEYFAKRAPIYIAEPCGTVEVAIRQIERAASEGVRVVAVDYAQLLKGKGKDQYERVTNVSNEMRRVTKKTGVLMLLLCQLSRPGKERPKYKEPNREFPRGVVPIKSDLRDSGYIEQDADVIIFLQWPLEGNPRYKPYDEFFIYVDKNRNRPTHQREIRCRIIPSRQLIEETGARHGEKYVAPYKELEEFNY